MNSTPTLSDIRRHLHQYPDLSGKEENTTKYILPILQKTKPTTLITNLCKTGLAVIYDTKKPGPILVFRAELDALPIKETNNFSYKSTKNNISHVCGHDGHITILIGLAQKIQQNLHTLNGKIALIFQPAEETAQGAHCICKSNFYKNLHPDFVFALHNLPGYPLKTIILKDNIFAIASKGLIVNLIGKTAHAGHPEQGNDPLIALLEIIDFIQNLSKQYKQQNSLALCTIIHIKHGEIAFGTTPGHAVLMMTFRAPTDRMLQEMTAKVTRNIKKIITNHQLKHSLKWVEDFPATTNQTQATNIIEQAAKNINYPIKHITKPFSWTEDFSYYLQHTPGALFGIGSGTAQPPLHSEKYDFPDQLLTSGINIFYAIISHLNQTNPK